MKKNQIKYNIFLNNILKKKNRSPAEWRGSRWTLHGSQRSGLGGLGRGEKHQTQPGDRYLRTTRNTEPTHAHAQCQAGLPTQ